MSTIQAQFHITSEVILFTVYRQQVVLQESTSVTFNRRIPMHIFIELWGYLV